MFLSELKAHAGAVKAMDRVMTNLPDNAPPELLMSAARLYAAAQQPAKMIDPLSRYLRQRPNDWQGWMDLATLYAMQNNLPNAQTALRRALELGGDEARSMVSRNPNLRSVAESMGTGGASLPNMGLGW